MMVYKRATLERIQGKNITLKLENGQELTLSRDEFEPLPPIGTDYAIQIIPEVEASMQREELAYTLLNQILNDDAEKSQVTS